jgi:hypothetical protein
MSLEDDIEELIEREYAGITQLPSLNTFIERYSRPMDGNDIKAIKVFLHYEGMESRRALQRELFLIKNSGVANFVLQRICGVSRKGRYGGFEKWAERILLEMSSPNKSI